MKIALALLALTGVAHAETDTGETAPRRSKYSFDIGSYVRWFGDTSAAIVTTENMPGLRMTVGRSLTSTTVLDRTLDIGLYGRWIYAAAGGTMFNNLDTFIGQNLLGAGARVDAPVFRWLSINGQAEGGLSRTSLVVNQDQMEPVNDHKWAPYVAASLGGELHLSKGKRVEVSIGMDVGYILTTPVELRALPGDRPSEDLSIDTSFASIGKLDTRGFTYSMSLRGRF